MTDDARREERPPSYAAIMHEATSSDAGARETIMLLCAAALWHVQRLQALMAMPQAGLLRRDYLLARLKAVQGSEGVEARFAQAAQCDDEQQAQRLYLSVAAEMEELVAAIDNAREYQARLDDALELVQGAYALLAEEAAEAAPQGADDVQQSQEQQVKLQHAEKQQPTPDLVALGGCLERLAMAHEVQQPALLDEAFVMLQTLGQGGSAQSH